MARLVSHDSHVIGYSLDCRMGKVSKHRIKSCARKKKYYSKYDAIKAINYMYKTYGARMTYYRCKAVMPGHWHIASKTPRRYR